MADPDWVARGLVTGQLFVNRLGALGVNLTDLGAKGLGVFLDQSAVQFQFHVADRAHAAIARESQFLRNTGSKFQWHRVVLRTGF